ncbi:hypothetical protein GB931_14870 [Modestobacter sp. I12A-02628]|uniref:Lipoprotein n=1 Tax=Goekera deserti TaxID=2497753 RepID=A0A7K3WAH4_9ACTN|nr:hypothetical protein [Goekera deserti]MPQ99180.1 hypothetical protein [Goekera deserti]NDI47515.1 hypothetical protein [Goekera deserti]NEL53326.1 hypothetical protein [Goekera deserti]
MSPRPARLLAAAGAVALLTGCGFASDLTDADPAPSPFPDASATAAAAPSTPPDEPVVVAEAVLVAVDGARVTLTVTADPVRPGLPMGAGLSGCTLAPGDPTRSVRLSLTLSGVVTDSRGEQAGLMVAGRVRVAAQDPADAVGALVASSAAQDACPVGTGLEGSDTFAAPDVGSGTRATVQAFVVAAGPGGGVSDPAALPRVTVRLEDLREIRYDPDTSEPALTLSDPTVGSRCPDDPGTLCATLG